LYGAPPSKSYSCLAGIGRDKSDLERAAQEANPLRCWPQKDCSRSEIALGKGEAGTGNQSLTEGTKAMTIGDRLRELREHKKLSQGDIEKRTGLLRCYISRVECGHIVPAVETLEKFARALEVPIYQQFYEGEKPPELPNQSPWWRLAATILCAKFVTPTPTLAPASKTRQRHVVT
jgi:transcriptional regulator with XRE-family HTH domain